MNQLQRNATACVERALQAEKSERFADAAAAYADALVLLTSVVQLEGSAMGAAARDQLIAYTQQIEQRAKLAKSKAPQKPQTAATVSPSVLRMQPTPHTALEAGTKPDHKDPSLLGESKKAVISNPPLKTGPQTAPEKKPDAAAVPRVPVAGSSKKPEPDTTAAVPGRSTLPEADQAPPHSQPSLVASSAHEHKLAPRTSVVVLRAIDLATSLSRQRKYKQAVDVLQHAYDVGRAEGNNPANFPRILDLIADLKRKYYDVFKPRFFQDNKITSEEMDIIRRSGQTTTILLPIWDDVAEGYAGENVYLPSKGDWTDAFTPSTSPKQQKAGCVMLRFPAVVSDASQLVVYKEADPTNIKQTVVGDCSLVCSLIVCSNFEKRFPSYHLISSVIFPQDENGQPIVSPKGKYCVKMFVNGITRMIVVDDRIPVTKALLPAPAASSASGSELPECVFTRQPLCTYSRDARELWVSIIEKAFVKVCGGSYDFPGSNSSVDMFKISGWLPDGFYFDGEGVDLELQWSRLKASHARGAVLATVSTPQNLGANVEEKLKLVPGHAYAVLDVVEVDGRRLMKIKNPWATQSWAGLYSLDDKNWPPALLETLKFTEEEANQGVFWMSYADVCKFYKRCNLSWNPYLLFSPDGSTPRKPHRLAVHGVLRYSEAFEQCPQYHIEVRNSTRAARMHLVLTRHVTDLAAEYQRAASDDDNSPLITVHVFDVTASPSIAQLRAGRTAVSSAIPACGSSRCKARLVVHGAELLGGDAACVHRGVYRNVECQTVSFNCGAGDRDLVVVVSQYQGSAGTSFPFSLILHTDIAPLHSATTGAAGVDLHALSTNPAALPSDGDAASDRTFVSCVSSAWVQGKSCGGKNESQTFVFNPQFLLSLAEPSHVCARLCSPQMTEAIQLQLVKLRPVASQANLQTPWQKRVGHINPRQCDVVLQCPLFLHRGCTVDTALPSCLVYDATNTVKPPAEMQPPVVAPPSEYVEDIVVQLPKLSRQLRVPRAHASIPLYPMVITAALAESLLASPLVTKVVFGGEEVKADSTRRAGALLQPNAALVAILQTEDLQRTPKMQECVLRLFGLASDVMGLVVGSEATEDVRKWSTACAVIDERLTQLVISLDDLPCPTDAVKDCRKALVLAAQSLHAVVDALLSLGSARTLSTAPTAKPAPSAPEPPLNPLPAGEYVLIPSTWSKGCPSKFQLTVETTAPHTVDEVPAEGAGWTAQVVQSQFRGGIAPAPGFFSASSGTSAKLQLALGHEYFAAHPAFTVQCTGSGSTSASLFSARVITVESDTKQERSSVSMAIAVFVAVSASAAELLQVTPFSASSCALEFPELLHPQRQYLVVVMSGAASTQPFVLKCYGSKDFSVRANN